MLCFIKEDSMNIGMKLGMSHLIDRVLGRRFLGSRSLGFPIDFYIYFF